MACLSPAIIQPANMTHPATRTPAAMAKNINMTYLALLTMVSPPSPKVSVMLPQSRAKAGSDAPIARAAIEPRTMSIISALVANLKSWKKGTFLGLAFCY